MFDVIVMSFAEGTADKSELCSRLLVKRLGLPADVVSLALFLVSDESSMSPAPTS
jgi:hypothetical protein